MYKKLYFFLGIAPVLLCGCNYSSNSEVNENAAMYGGYGAGNTYRLKQDVFLLILFFKKEEQFALSPDGESLKSGRNYSAPSSIGDFRKDGKGFSIVEGVAYHVPTTPLGIVGGGATIKVVTAIKRDSFSWFFGENSSITVFGEILDGDHKGKVVNLNDLSVGEILDNVKVRSPNLAFLAPI